MISELNSATTFIGRLQIKGAVDDPTLARLRATSLLEAADLSVAQVTPSAIVFIRKLRDPMPGTLSLDRSNPHLPAAWNRALGDSLRQLTSRAVRPALSRATGNEEAVIFLDVAELLACLAADLRDGVVSARWWWKSFRKRGDVMCVFKQMCLEKVEYLPATLEHLVRRGVLVEIVSCFSDEEVSELVQRVVRVFGVTRIERIRATHFFRERMPIQEMKVRQEMPWKSVVPESDTLRLRPVQQMFIGIALMIQRAPTRVRTLSFAREVERWVEQVVFTETGLEPIIEVTRENPQAPEPAENLTPIRADQIVAATVRRGTTEPPQKKSVSSLAKTPEHKIGNAVFTYEEIAIEPARIVTEPPSVVQSEPPVDVTAPETVASVESPSLDAIMIETELGGLFYLINLALFMEIESEALSIWDFVVIVGREINQDRYLEDPLWTGLQDLHDEHDKNHVNPQNLENPVPAWLTELMPHLQRRLRQSLGIDDEVDLGELLLHHHARVIITPTHLDVFFALAQHPIEIRLSGLDRNPGWVPAAGRFIAFHYD